MIQYIELGGKNRPIRYSHKALRMIAAELNAKTFQDLGQKVSEMGIEDIPFLAYVGLKEGARKATEPFDATVETVGEWLDDEAANIFAIIMEAFTNDFEGSVAEKKIPAKGKAAK